MRKRTIARETVLKILYQKEITRRDLQKTIEEYREREGEMDSEAQEFATRLVYGVDRNMEAIDQKISEYATNWQLKRMAVIDRNILRLGVFELKYAPDIPPKVTINEMVELAKKYGDLESSKFVNGILDKIHKTEIIKEDSPS
jgi:N utilization substance protein B